MPSTTADSERCPECGAGLVVAGEAGRRAVCPKCGSCFERAPGRLAPVDSVACPGCARRSLCASRPTWLVDEATTEHTLATGERVLIRPLLYSDRDELVAGYERLSAESRRLRFFAAPDHLSPSDVEYLTKLDYDRHYALAAFMLDEDGTPGVGVARYIRLRRRPRAAEAAVTVLDQYQARGIGTLLLTRLSAVGRRHGIEVFVTFVLWDNVPTVDALREAGARVLPEEPGIARLEIDLPEEAKEDEAMSPLRRALHTAASMAAAALRSATS